MNKNKGILLILGTAFISGAVVFISKFGVSIINPYIFAGLKNIIVALLIVSWLFVFFVVFVLGSAFYAAIALLKLVMGI